MNTLETIAARSEPILNAQRISAAGPGTILRDFEALIDFIGEHGLPTKSKQGNLSAAVLPEIKINVRLAAPIEVPLARPLLQHYPNIAGLFVLLRVMNLARVDRKRLWIDAAALASWREFNPAEKYFALLEACMRMRMGPERQGRGRWNARSPTRWFGARLRPQRVGDNASHLSVFARPL